MIIRDNFCRDSSDEESHHMVWMKNKKKLSSNTLSYQELCKKT